MPTATSILYSRYTLSRRPSQYTLSSTSHYIFSSPETLQYPPTLFTLTLLTHPRHHTLLFIRYALSPPRYPILFGTHYLFAISLLDTKTHTPLLRCTFLLDTTFYILFHTNLYSFLNTPRRGWSYSLLNNLLTIPQCRFDCLLELFTSDELTTESGNLFHKSTGFSSSWWTTRD